MSKDGHEKIMSKDGHRKLCRENYVKRWTQENYVKGWTQGSGIDRPFQQIRTFFFHGLPGASKCMTMKLEQSDVVPSRDWRRPR